jgi:hypothetical protein
MDWLSSQDFIWLCLEGDFGVFGYSSKVVFIAHSLKLWSKFDLFCAERVLHFDVFEETLCLSLRIGQSVVEVVLVNFHRGGTNGISVLTRLNRRLVLHCVQRDKRVPFARAAVLCNRCALRSLAAVQFRLDLNVWLVLSFLYLFNLHQRCGTVFC